MNPTPDDHTTPSTENIATLKARVYDLVRACPAGRVTTYGWLAKAVGFPRGARMVGWIMNEAEGVPAQRVINSKGELSGSWAFGQRGKMRQLLEAEGIVFSAAERVDLKQYGWDPNRDLSPEELQGILEGTDATAIAPSARLINLMLNDPASPLK